MRIGSCAQLPWTRFAPSTDALQYQGIIPHIRPMRFGEARMNRLLLPHSHQFGSRPPSCAAASLPSHLDRVDAWSTRLPVAGACSTSRQVLGAAHVRLERDRQGVFPRTLDWGPPTDPEFGSDWREARRQPAVAAVRRVPARCRGAMTWPRAGT